MARTPLLLILLFATFACQFKAKEETGALIAGHQTVSNKFTVSVPTSKTYIENETLTFTLNFPYDVTVTGAPRLQLTIGASSVYANYTIGSGTKHISFAYTVQAMDVDSDGISVGATIDLNGGTLTFTGTNGADNCNVNISVPSTSGIKVDTVGANVLGVSAPSNFLYMLGMQMTFTVLMDEAVTVTGTPRLTLTVGSTTRYANYVSGSGGTTLFFRYTVVSSDTDMNGIAMTSSIDLNGGTLKDTAGNSATLTFTAPNTTGVLTDGNTPYVTAVTPPSNGSYVAGSNLDFVFTFSEAVNVNATPTIALTIGSTSRTATYQSGAGSTQLTFRHIIQSGDLDLDGITSASSFTFSGGAWIRDSGGTNALNTFVMPSLTGVLITDSSPRITSFSIANATYYIGSTINIDATYDQAVTITGTPRIPISLNTGGTVYANYVSGSGGTIIRFSYTVTSGTDDTNGITLVTPMELNGGTIRNVSSVNAALGFTIPSTTLVRVSGTRPVVTSVTPPADGTYLTGQTMDFVVNFSENVTAGNTANLLLNLTVGSTSRTATYQSGSGSSALTFRYTVVGADADTDGINVDSPLTVNLPGYITDGTSTNNLATVTFSAPSTTGVLVNATVPSISSVTPPGAGTKLLATDVDFQVVFSENVTVTGSPTLSLTVGSTARNATYVSGSGTSTLTFRYTVPLNDLDTNGIASASPLVLNGGTIRSSLGMNATLNFTAPDTSGINVDGDVPDVLSTGLPANSLYDVTDTSWTFTVTFDQAVTVIGTPRWVLNVGGTTRYANYIGGSGTNTLTFSHTIDATDVDLDGISLGNSGNLDLNSGTASISDSNSNSANLSLNSPSVSGIYLTYPNMVGWWDMDDPMTVTTASCGIQTCAAGVHRSHREWL